jgi:hypothetical protein
MSNLVPLAPLLLSSHPHPLLSTFLSHLAWLAPLTLLRFTDTLCASPIPDSDQSHVSLAM